ncbi:reverse transcriptase domain-containing protein [Leuconostoc sp. MS02]|uniref:Reverse transcriptase domain-containing protein n=1 Tax=Leuconostoc aquikimchii TaxID=3236804 RepID=A0ABV3S2X7_9LACO
MNSNNYTISKLNKKRNIYKITDSKLENDYHELAELFKHTYNHLPNRNRALKKVVRSLTPRLYNMNKQGHYFVTCLPKTIIRGDIKDFFPSINKHILYKHIIHSSRLTLDNSHRKLLSDMLFDPNFIGLPQGLSISSILSEVYLEEFDKLIELKFPECVYIRYVDDFLLICPTSQIYKYNFSAMIQNLLSEYKLKLSDSKFSVTSFDDSSEFVFLGYHFRRENKSMIISIDNSKITKLQKRINSYFYDYLKHDTSFEKLYLRLKNIFYGVTTLAPSTSSKQRQGIPYSYPHITSFENIQYLINNIEYQLKKCRNLKFMELKKIRKLYFPYSHFDNKRSDAVQILLKQRFNYLNLNVKQLVSLLKTLDSSFVYANQPKTSLVHLLFFMLYNS